MPTRYTLGIDLGGTTTYLAAADAHNNLGWETSFRTALTPTAEAFIARVAELTARARTSYLWEAAAVAAAAQVDQSRGYLVASPNLPFADIALGPALAEALGVPVRVENDVNAAAWGEYLGYPGAREPLLAVFAGTGVGAGLIAGSAVIRGADGFAAEIGHVPVVRDGGERCNCGNRGCLEAYAGGLALCRRASEAAPRADGRPYQRVDEIVAAAAGGNALCAALLEDAAAYLGMALAAAVNLYNPGTLVLGGGVTRAWPPLYGKSLAALKTHGLAPALKNLTTAPSKWGARAGAIGAAALARELLRPLPKRGE